MHQPVPAAILDMLKLADPSWHPGLEAGLGAVARAAPDYLPMLAADSYLPTDGRLFAAFAQPLDTVRYVLVGEGPYPREQSATGVCFMDGAVGSLWSDQGLSKQVNRATSLRNFVKMLLLADGQIAIGQTTGAAMAHVSLKARATASPFIQTLAEMQGNLARHGFLLLNAALVYRKHVPPKKEARAWQPFVQEVLAALAAHADITGKSLPALVLWGKVAEQFNALPLNTRFPKTRSEHPYNLSFIANPDMQALFGPMHLLKKWV